MHSFKQYLTLIYKTYPNSTIKDYLKLIYQSEFAGGHMIKSKETSLSYLTEEIITTEKDTKPLYEYISNNIVRINLSSYKNNNLDINTLNNLFFNSANLDYPNITLKNKLDALIELTENNIIKISDYSIDVVENFKLDPTLVHHSQPYRDFYNPHYRVINTKYLPLEFRILKLQNYINSQPKDKLTIIAIEGRCASGKTTITNSLKNVTIIHADDFFSKTDVLDFDKLSNVLSNLKLNESLTYTTFNCMNNTYNTKTIDKIQHIVLVEGVFSYHPKIRKFYNQLIYIESSKELQLERLKQRTTNPLLYEKFINIWIPREEEYYNNNNYIIQSNIII